MAWTPELEAEYQALEAQYGAKLPTDAPPAVVNNPGANQALLESKGKKIGEISGENQAGLPRAYSTLQTAAQQAAKQIELANKVATDVSGVGGKGSYAVGIFDANTPTFLQSTRDTIADIEGLDAANFIGAIKTLKDQSPTGATGLGSATEREGEKLQKANFNFDRSQSETRFGKTAQDYRDQIRHSFDNTVKAFNDTYGTKYTADDLMKQYSPDPESTKAAIRAKYGL
jgi:hypothetical protein